MLVEGGGLGVVDEEEEGVAFEGVAGFFELGFPVDEAAGFYCVAVERGFGVGGLDEAAEGVGSTLLLFEVEVLDFLIDAGTDELPDGDMFGEEFDGDVAGGGVGCGGLIVHGDGGHGGSPRGILVLYREGWMDGKRKVPGGLRGYLWTSGGEGRTHFLRQSNPEALACVMQ